MGVHYEGKGFRQISSSRPSLEPALRPCHLGHRMRRRVLQVLAKASRATGIIPGIALLLHRLSSSGLWVQWCCCRLNSASLYVNWNPQTAEMQGARPSCRRETTFSIHVVYMRVKLKPSTAIPNDEKGGRVLFTVTVSAAVSVRGFCRCCCVASTTLLS